MKIQKNLSDTKNYSLLPISGELEEIVIAVPHHAPLGVPNLPCKEHPDADENAGFLGYEVARLLNCNGIIACNSPIDPNKDKESEYFKKIQSWRPKILVEIHGHSSSSAKFDIEISSGSKKRNGWSRALAEKLEPKLSKIPSLQKCTMSGDFEKIYFKATKTLTITTADWIAFHIELPKTIRAEKSKYTVFCKLLAEALNEILADYTKLKYLENESAT